MDTITSAKSPPRSTTDDNTANGLLQIVKAGALYFVLAVGAGFVLEVVRLQVIALHVNERFAGMLEIPSTVLATMIAARWVVDRFTLPPLPGTRLSVGIVACCLMVLAEVTIVLPFYGLSPGEYLSSQLSLVGILPLGALGVLTVIPFLVGYRWER